MSKIHFMCKIESPLYLEIQRLADAHYSGNKSAAARELIKKALGYHDNFEKIKAN